MRNSDSNSLLILRLLSGLALVLTAISSLPHFTISDDIILRFIVSGYFGEGTETFTLYSHAYLAQVFASLYASNPSIDWYTVIYEGLVIGGSAYLTFLLSSSKKNNITNALNITLITTATLPFIIYFQYTSVAFFLVCIGVFGIFHQRGIVLINILLLTLAILIRQEVFLAALLFSLPMVWRSILNNTRQVRLSIGLATIIYVLLSVAHTAHYSNSSYPLALKAKNEHWKLYDAHFDKQNYLSSLENLGWDYENLATMRANKHFDSDVYTPENFIYLLKDVKPKRPVHLWSASFIPLIKNQKRVLAFLFIGLLFALTLSTQRSTYKISYAVYLLLILIALIWVKKITLPILLGVSFYYLIFLLCKIKEASKLSLVLALFLSCTTLAYTISKKTQRSNLVSTKIQKLHAKEDSLFIIGNSPLAYQLKELPFYTPFIPENHNVLYTGWLTNTPAFSQWLKNHKISNLKNPPKSIKVSFVDQSPDSE